MAIVDCGFLPEILVPHPDGSTVSRSGHEALQGIGPTLLVEVGYEATLHAEGANAAEVAMALANGSTRPAIARIVPALIDTGARNSFIDEDLAIELGLPLVDRQQASGIGGREELNVYSGHIRIPSLGQIRWGTFAGARLTGGGQQHRALIGRAQFRLKPALRLGGFLARKPIRSPAMSSPDSNPTLRPRLRRR
jgi:hypothetical protein